MRLPIGLVVLLHTVKHSISVAHHACMYHVTYHEVQEVHACFRTKHITSPFRIPINWVWEWHHSIFKPSCAFLSTGYALCYSIVCIGGLRQCGGQCWICSACWCAWRVSYDVGNWIVALTEHGRYDLFCMQKLWSAWAVQVCTCMAC